MRINPTCSQNSNQKSLQKKNQPDIDKRIRGISSRFLRRGALPKRILFFPPAEPDRLISRVVVIDTATEIC